MYNREYTFQVLGVLKMFVLDLCGLRKNNGNIIQ